jgi:hypothetical protein
MCAICILVHPCALRVCTQNIFSFKPVLTLGINIIKPFLFNILPTSSTCKVDHAKLGNCIFLSCPFSSDYRVFIPTTYRTSPCTYSIFISLKAVSRMSSDGCMEVAWKGQAFPYLMHHPSHPESELFQPHLSLQGQI